MPDLIARIPRHRGNRNRPDVSRWRQQTLPAYRPLITMRCALPITTVASGLFITFGILIFLAAKSGKELVIDYTNCTISNGTKARNLQSPVEPCTYAFFLEDDLMAPVMFQYGLEDFYQNARMYMKSRNDVQLIGFLNDTSDCHPYATRNQSGVVLSIVPCGSVANSMFNDTFKLYYQSKNGSSWIEVPVSAQDVIEDSERRKFKNPPYDSMRNETLCSAFAHTTKPPDWSREICELGMENGMNETERSEFGVGLENVDFIVWMSPAALPKFRKNYRSLKQISYFKDGLPVGLYQLEINYRCYVRSSEKNSMSNFIVSVWVGMDFSGTDSGICNYPTQDEQLDDYPVSIFDGGKRFIATEYGKKGPQNVALGILYIVFGFILMCASLITCLAIVRHADLHQTTG